jgi:hypothetical protein
MYRYICILIALAVALAVGPHTPATAGELNEELMWRAPAIHEYLHEQHYRNVGVLKFQVQRDNPSASDAVGEVNAMLANRLELALVLATPADRNRQIGIIRDANEMAAFVAGANHLDPNGRRSLLDHTYPLAWSAKQVKPDALLTGRIELADDLSSLAVQILAFDRGSSELQRVIPRFTATADPATLAEFGESYVVAQAAPQSKLVVQRASHVKNGTDPFPLVDPAAPVKLEILYDGQPAPIEIRNGRAFVPEPDEHRQVRFVVSHHGPSDATYGVVLKVNGQNTLYRQWWRAIDCAKWILRPGAEPLVIDGFQENSAERTKFRVLSRAESTTNAIRYGKETGQISLTVFRQRTDSTPTPGLLDDDSEDLMAITRGAYPDTQAENFFALKNQLLASATAPVRGLIDGGERVESLRPDADFDADPTPVLAATITYYPPAD